MVMHNLMFATAYTLNNSNTKRVVVGLEYSDGSCKIVIKLCTNGSPSKYLTFAPSDWEVFKEKWDVIAAYFTNDYKFCNDHGKPSSVKLANHLLLFTLAYGEKAINIEQKQKINETEEKQQERERKEEGEDEEEIKSLMNDYCDVPQIKRKKYGNEPYIVLQQTTFDGLRNLSECISVRIQELEENVEFLNSCIDKALEYIKILLNKEGTDRAREILKSKNYFRQFYVYRQFSIENAIEKTVNFDNVDKHLIKVLEAEMAAYGVYSIADYLYKLMFDS